MTTHRNRSTGLAVALIAVVGVAVLVSRAGDEPPGTFADAVSTGDVQLARSLAAGGADPDSPRILGMTPLMRAANRNDVAMIEVLVAAGADLAVTAQEGLTAVHVAAQADAATALVALAGVGAEVEAESHNGMAPIHHAAATGSIRALNALAQLGIDLDTPSSAVTQGHGYPRDGGATALGIAARTGHEEAVRLLIGLGAAVDARSRSGHTPLHLAVFAASPPAVVIALLVAGADPHVEAACELGCSLSAGDSLAWAQQLDRDELIPILEQAATAVP